MAIQTVENQTRMYLFDLLSIAKEHGFKSDDNWELSMATDSEKTRIQKDYFPTLSARVIPEVLLQMFHAIKTSLNQPQHKSEPTGNGGSLNGELIYLVAYNPKRPRR